MRAHPYIEGRAPKQGTYLPECLDEVISRENPIRFIRLFVMQLDLVKMGFVRSKPKDTGRPRYDPAVLLMLYIYGHLNRVRSSRLLIPGEITEAKRAGRKPEDIRACLHAGVLPKCYEGTDISVELQYESVTSCFLRHEDGTVTCPMGKLKERFRVSKHPFGTIKFYDGAHDFLCKGKEKVAAETSLMFTSYNIRRAIALAGGVQKLIGRVRYANIGKNSPISREKGLFLQSNK